MIVLSVDIYSSTFMQIILFALLSAVLLVSAISLFIRPAKRTIRASLVEANTGHIIDISSAETSIGRAKACDVIISVMSVSRFHAVLSKRKTGWMIFDTNSTSGTYVNGEKVEKKAILNDGDSLIFGDKEYIFYSTAVTTRQQITPKSGSRGKSVRNTSHNARTNTSGNRDDGIEYKSPKKSSSSRNTNSNSRKKPRQTAIQSDDSSVEYNSPKNRNVKK